MLKESKKISELFKENMEMLKHPDRLPMYIKTGYKSLDKLLDGFMLGEFVVIGAKMSMGMEKLLQNLAINISKSTPILFISLKSNESYLTNQFISTIKGIEINKSENYDISKNEQLILESIERNITDLKLFVNNVSFCTLTEFRSLIKKNIKKHSIKAIIIDDMQLLKLSDDCTISKNIELVNTSKVLKKIASDFNISVIAGTQINKTFESNQEFIGEKPKLEDLWNCGYVVQCADKIILLYRPEYYGILESDFGNSTKNRIELLIVKNKSGCLGDIYLRKNKNFSCILNLDDYDAEQRAEVDLLI